MRGSPSSQSTGAKVQVWLPKSHAPARQGPPSHGPKQATQPSTAAWAHEPGGVCKVRIETWGASDGDPRTGRAVYVGGKGTTSTGGWYGGGGACHCKAAAGGSSYTGGVGNATTSTGGRTGHGQVVFTW